MAAVALIPTLRARYLLPCATALVRIPASGYRVQMTLVEHTLIVLYGCSPAEIKIGFPLEITPGAVKLVTVDTRIDTATAVRTSSRRPDAVAHGSHIVHIGSPSG